MIKLVLISALAALVAVDAAQFQNNNYQPFASRYNPNSQSSQYPQYNRYSQNNNNKNSRYPQYNKYSPYPQYQVTKPVTTQAPVTTPIPVILPSTTVPPRVLPVVQQYQYGNERAAAILKSESNINADGSYEYAYETENGISAQEQGAQRAYGAQDSGTVVQGAFHFKTPEGVPVDVTYVADENGYQPQSDLIPTPPPVPAAILRALAWNEAHPEEQREEVQPQRRYRRAVYYY